MGKIRIKTLGDEELEKKQKKEAKKKKELRKQAKVHDVENTEEEKIIKKEAEKTPEAALKKPIKKAINGKKRSIKYQTVSKLIEKQKIYSLEAALNLLPKLKLSTFDETVELHINTTEAGISGNLALPHGTGKKIKVAIADDTIIAAVEKGKIDFDVLLATPQMMPKLAKVARILGPRGLMPNPKNGTISQDLAATAKKFEGGQTNFKTEAKTPIIHLIVGKLSFGDKKLSENIKATINAIQAGKIRKAVLKSTMSPGIKIDTSSTY